jgi:hypothetical protein
MRRLHERLDYLVGCAWFWVWALVGFGVALGFISVLGPLVFLPAALVAIGLLSSRQARESIFGVVTGAGLLALFIAWLHRRGPGTVCWSKGTSSGCDQYLNPWPWLAVGAVLVVTGIVAHARRAD